MNKVVDFILVTAIVLVTIFIVLSMIGGFWFFTSSMAGK